MQKLFLTSSGITPNLIRPFVDLIGRPTKNLQLAFILTASTPLPKKEKRYIKIERNYLQKLGFNILDVNLEDHTVKSFKELLKNFQVIYLVGGNTYYLMYWLNKLKVNKYLKKQINDGLIYVGSSAGSIVAGPSISLAGWEQGDNIHGAILKNLSGLNIVKFTISPHFIENIQRRDLIKKQKLHFQYPVICLKNHQVVIVDDSECILMGSSTNRLLI